MLLHRAEHEISFMWRGKQILYPRLIVYYMVADPDLLRSGYEEFKSDL